MGLLGATVIKVAASESLGERYNEAQAMHGSAFSIFEDVASQLAEAEARFCDVVAETQEEITRLRALQDDALVSAANARAARKSLLDLINGKTDD